MREREKLEEGFRKGRGQRKLRIGHCLENFSCYILCFSFRLCWSQCRFSTAHIVLTTPCAKKRKDGLF